MKEEKALVIGKKIECIFGIIFMIPHSLQYFVFCSIGSIGQMADSSNYGIWTGVGTTIAVLKEYHHLLRLFI